MGANAHVGAKGPRPWVPRFEWWLVALLLTGGPAHADAPSNDGSSGGPELAQATSEPHSEAAKLTRQAQTLYMEGKYARARDHYQDAYHLSARPALLFNIAQCHRQLGDYREAVFLFDLFLQQQPDSPHRDLAESLMAESKAKLAVRDVRVSLAPKPGQPPPHGAPERHPSPPQPPPASPDNGRRTQRRVAIATMTTVLGVAAVTAVVATVRSGRRNTSEAEGASLITWD